MWLIEASPDHMIVVLLDMHYERPTASLSAFAE